MTIQTVPCSSITRFRSALAAALLSLIALMPLDSRAESLKVVASFSILADLVSQVGGPRVEVKSLIGPGEDAHGYQPRPSDAVTVKAADLVFVNGLGFDQWMERLAAASGGHARIVVASAGIAALEHGEEHAHHGHAHGPLDPHAWQDIAHARRYLENIAAALSIADPDGAVLFSANRERLDAALAALDAQFRERLQNVPAQQRKAVTVHEAFGYLSHAYGIRFIAANGVSETAEPSAAGLARLIRQLRREQVPVVFIENVSDPRVMEQISRESGAKVGGTLYSDALSEPDGPAPTYLDMMRHNFETLLEGLTPTAH